MRARLRGWGSQEATPVPEEGKHGEKDPQRERSLSPPPIPGPCPRRAAPNSCSPDRPGGPRHRPLARPPPGRAADGAPFAAAVARGRPTAAPAPRRLLLLARIKPRTCRCVWPAAPGPLQPPPHNVGQLVGGAYGCCCLLPAVAVAGTRLPTMDESEELRWPEPSLGHRPLNLGCRT